MINFFYDKKTRRKNTWKLCKVLFGKYLIVGSITFILGAVVYNIGLNYRIMEYVSSGAIILFVGGVSLFAFFRLVYPFYEKITSTFKNYAKDGLLHYSLFVRDSKFVRKCVESEEEFEFAKEDIKEIKREKNIIVVRLHSKYVVDFPNRDDIYELLMN
ncbi:MAG: hypothetical protein IKM40_02445 [Clostridia bacterium]|nr:hypothetical protein [Clostridia bacterium]